DRDRLVGRARVQRTGVVGRRDRDRAEPEPPRGAEDADRDLAAVRYEEPADLHSPPRVTSASAARVRYGTASLVCSATAPPSAAPPAWPGAHARLSSANA